MDSAARVVLDTGCGHWNHRDGGADMKWQAGDRAIIANNAKCKSDNLLNYVGEECVLIQYFTTVEGENSTMTNAWQVEVMGDAFLVVERILRKPPHDGNDLAEWADIEDICGWTPKVLERV